VRHDSPFCLIVALLSLIHCSAVPRLFVAIDFPPELKLCLSQLCTGLSGARWVEPGNFHLTLRFVGEVDDPLAAEVDRVLARIRAHAFDLALAGVGHFGGHTLWVGIEHNPALMCLQAAIEKELQQIGVAADPRPFAPHVKLARLNRRRGLRAFLREHRDFRSQPFAVRQFSLIESRLDARGPTYQHRADYPLGEEGALAPTQECAVDD
jgi:RNA 2',3'-cyclic 3'-phosphodiesterase